MRRGGDGYAVLAFAIVLTRALPALADGGLEVVPLEGGTWASHVVMLQTTPWSTGLTAHVQVIEEDTRRVVPCGQYTLGLDPRGLAAFRVGQCDPTTGATEIMLVDRPALFAPSSPLPYPVPIALAAASTRQETFTAPVVGVPQAGMELRCSASVRPFMVDAATGTNVYLTPDRYRLDPLDTRVHAQAGPDAWMVSTSSREALFEASFRIVELRSEQEIARSRVSLRCSVADGTTARRISLLSTPGVTPIRLPAGAVGRGVSAVGPLAQLTCTDAPAPTVVWRFRAPADGTFEVLLQGGFDTALEVRTAADAPRSLGCNDNDGGSNSHSRVVMQLQRGEQYDFLVSGQDGSAGRYEIAVISLRAGVELHDNAREAHVTRLDR